MNYFIQVARIAAVFVLLLFVPQESLSLDQGHASPRSSEASFVTSVLPLDAFPQPRGARQQDEHASIMEVLSPARPQVRCEDGQKANAFRNALPPDHPAIKSDTRDASEFVPQTLLSGIVMRL